MPLPANDPIFGDASGSTKLPGLTRLRFEDVDDKDGFEVNIALVGATAATAANYSTFYNVMRPCEVFKASASWTTASTSGTLQIERLSGTEAPASGDTILVGVFRTDGTANTVNTKKGTELQNTILKEGDRLALIDSGTLTNLTDLAITIFFKPLGKGHYQ
jgi:hypothetical protein|tara:strand:+ start:539 stop:1021 length:483 start_codon:yes stop_codon:yes gene_type:complete